MKKIVCVVCLMAMVVSLSFIAGTAMSQEASAEQGKKLFSDPTLGGSKNEKSCNSCHPGGEGLEEAGAQSNLQEMINFCIERPLKGKKLQDGSAELE